MNVEIAKERYNYMKSRGYESLSFENGWRNMKYHRTVGKGMKREKEKLGKCYTLMELERIITE